MSFLSSLFVLLLFLPSGTEDIRVMEHNGAKVKTSFTVDSKFIGTYKGSKPGYLVLNDDGTGVYRYDYEGLGPADCEGTEINIIWGFIVEENGDLVKFERSYGYSYPIVYNAIGEGSFKGCTSRSMIDYILEYEDGTITVSSSDDWEKVVE